MEKWQWLTLAIVVYALIMLYIGVHAESGEKKSKNLEDYFLGGRSMGPILSLGAMTTTVLSSFALLGMPGYFYQFGVGSWILILMNGFFWTLINFPWMFRSRYLGKKFGFVTLGDYMEKRYSSTMRILSSISMILVSIPYCAIQIQGFGNISEGVTGGKLPFVVGAIFLALIMAVYIFAGGYKGVAATDAVQGLLMVFALLFGGVYLCNKLCGSVPGMFQHLMKTNPDWLGLPGGSGKWTMKSVTEWAVFMCGMSVTPQIFQKFFTNRDLPSMKASVFFHPFLTFVIYTGAMLIGLAGLVAFPGLSSLQSDNIAMMVIAKYLPTWMGMFITVGIVAAAMSTADSQYITISSLFVRDIYQMGIKRGKEVDMNKMVKMGRWFSLMLMAAGFAIAYARLDTLVGMLTKTVYPLGMQLYIPMITGMYWKRANSKGAITGMLTGLFVCILTLFIPPFTALGNIMHPLFWGAIINVSLLVAVSMSTEAPNCQVIKECIDDVNAYVYDPAIKD
jgi:SSS family transporter